MGIRHPYNLHSRSDHSIDTRLPPCAGEGLGSAGPLGRQQRVYQLTSARRSSHACVAYPYQGLPAPLAKVSSSNRQV